MSIRPGEVPCNGCVACCRRENVLVSAGFGDDVSTFTVEREVRPGVFALAAQANGDCTYLDAEAGCTIHDRRPMICRSFDCRIEAVAEDRKTRVQDGRLDAAVLRAGRERFRAMPPAARAALLANHEARRRR